MKKLTLASLGLGVCLLSSLLIHCDSDSGGGMDTADMTQAGADMTVASGDMTPTPPDLAGVAPPTKVTGFMQPASAFWDVTTNSWYVSNVVTSNITDPKAFNDNNAYITKVPANLQSPDHNWFKGTAAVKLSAPFGLRVVGTKLYVGDINKLWVVDMTNPTGANTIQSGTVAAGGLAALAGYPAFLIDVALDASGNVYAVDATGGRVLKWNAGFAAGAMPSATPVAADTLAGASGINVDGTKLVIAEAGINQVLMKTGGISTANLDGSGLKRLVNSSKMTLAYQGIEKDTTANKYMIASPGDKVVYSIDPTSGASTILRDVSVDGATTATDIGWDPVGKVLAVPDTGANVVYFYKL